MWVALKQRAGVGAFGLAVCCMLLNGRVEAGDRAPVGSCACEPEPTTHFEALPPPPGPPAAALVAPLPPILPPPGTLGTTYRRRSWRIPANRHPRIAMLDVRAPAGAASVRVLTTYEYREEDEIEGFQDPNEPRLWHFESKPLIPGIPHVYEVVVDGERGEDARFVRLIRGRRVALDFEEPTLLDQVQPPHKR